MPARHQRRHDRSAVPEADRAGHADAGTEQFLDAPLGAQLRGETDHCVDHRGGTSPDVARLAHMVEHPQLAVGQRDVDRGRADVDAEEPQIRRQSGHGRAAAAAGEGGPGVLDKAELDQPPDLDRDLGARQPAGVTELGPGERSVVAQHPQHPGLMRVLRPGRHPLHRFPFASVLEANGRLREKRSRGCPRFAVICENFLTSFRNCQDKVQSAQAASCVTK